MKTWSQQVGCLRSGTICLVYQMASLRMEYVYYVQRETCEHQLLEKCDVGYDARRN